MNCFLKTAGRYLRYGFVGALMFAALPAHAASVSIFHDQSDALLVGANYDQPNSFVGLNFGIQKAIAGFGKFNLDFIAGSLTELPPVTPPNGWPANAHQSMAGAGFGNFNLGFIADSLTELPPPNSSPVPVPAAVWLFGSGLIGLLGFAKRRRVVKP